MPRSDGWLGWLAIGTVIAVWDLYAEATGRTETMSSAYCRADGAHPVLIGACTAVVVCHLKKWPTAFARIDPFRLMAVAVERRRAG